LPTPDPNVIPKGDLLTLALKKEGRRLPLYTDLWHSKWLLENEQRMRADVSELVYRARAVSAAGRQKTFIAPLPETWGLTMSLAAPSCVQELQTASHGISCVFSESRMR
jgi:hypothetical protein